MNPHYGIERHRRRSLHFPAADDDDRLEVIRPRRNCGGWQPRGLQQPPVGARLVERHRNLGELLSALQDLQSRRWRLAGRHNGSAKVSSGVFALLIGSPSDGYSSTPASLRGVIGRDRIVRGELFRTCDTTNRSPTTDFSAGGTVTDDDATLAFVPFASYTTACTTYLPLGELRCPEEEEIAGLGLR